MIKELTLSMEEIYYLGKLLGGKHINYRYIAAMPDISQNPKEHMQKCRNSLCDKGVLCENLWGDLEVDTGIKEFISPVFFGSFEASIEVVCLENPKQVESMYFHRNSKNCLISVENGQQVSFSLADDETLGNIVFALMPVGYNELEKPKLSELQNLNVQRMIIVKNIRINENVSAEVFYECKGWLCEMFEAEKYKILSPKQFYDKVFNMLEGGF